MSAIGGYFELETAGCQLYHEHAIALNTGRNALEYILLANGFHKVYLPYYTCHVLLQPIQRLGISYEYYQIDHAFEPLFDYGRLEDGEAFMYTNYYGLKDEFVQQLSLQLPSLIVDNAQAFYAEFPGGCHAFYSARKFFGVPDGGYAYTRSVPVTALPQDVSYRRFEHLLIRADQGAEQGYQAFVANDQALDHNPVRKMSVLTQKLLGSVPYSRYGEIRRSNYQYLYDALAGLNGIDLPLPSTGVPMIFPFLATSAGGLRRKLIENRIYVAQYWPEVLNLCRPGSIEHNYAENLIPLPIDQRLSTHHLNAILKTIKNAY